MITHHPSSSIHNFFKQHLLINHWASFNENSQDWSLDDWKLFKHLESMQDSGCHGNQKKKFKNLLVRIHLTNFSIDWQKCSFGDPQQDCSSCHYSSKNMATRGWGLFSLYIHIENFKNLLVRNHWTDFNITWQKCFFDYPLPNFLKPSWFIKKHDHQGDEANFSYISL